MTPHLTAIYMCVNTSTDASGMKKALTCPDTIMKSQKSSLRNQTGTFWKKKKRKKN